MKVITVPLSQEAMNRLDFDENIEGDLLELNVLPKEYEYLKNVGYFFQLNKQLDLMIDEYEVEKILYKYLFKALEITNNLSSDHKENGELWFNLKELINVAIKKRTGVFFFF